MSDAQNAIHFLKTPPPLQVRLRLLTRVSRALTNQSSVEPILHQVLASAVEMFDTSCAAIFLEREDRLLRAIFHRDTGFEAPAELPGQHLDERIAGILESTFKAPFVAVPLIAQARVLGILAVTADATGEREETEWLLSALADNAAISLKQSLDYQEAKPSLAQSFEMNDHSNRQLMMSALAHDLYSPLRTINIGCDLLERSMSEISEDQQEVLEHIRVSTRHLDALATNLVEMGRLSAGIANIAKVPCSLKRIADEATTIVAPDFKLRQQRLMPEVNDCQIHGDPDRIRQVLINLLSNACKYTHNGSTVELLSEEDESSIFLHVRDNGSGIPPDQQDAIFRPYYRWTSGNVPGNSGVGLGLAISRELMRKMGGELRLQSEVGSGSTFTLVFPGHCGD